MNFALNDEQLEFKASCRNFAREVIRPAARKHDEEESTPWEVDQGGAPPGPAGHRAPAAHGDRRRRPDGRDLAEEMHWGCAGTALAISGSGLAAAGIAASGTPEQIGHWVPECFGTGEEIKLGAYAVTEPQAGSDVKSLKTTARRDGDEWVLNGTKVFITNGGIADVHVVVATVDPELGHPRPGLLRRRQGHARAEPGQEGDQARDPRLAHRRGRPRGMPDPGREPARRRGEAGEEAGAGPLGAEVALGADALATFEITRPIVGASALGIAQAAYEWTLEYLDGQSEGGVPLLKTQRVQQTLADVATEIEAARLLVQRASWMGRNGVPMTGGQGSMSKLKAGDVTMWATTTLMDLVGPYAWNTDCPLEKWFRDAKIYQLFEGTAEIQRMVISRMQAREYAERFDYGAEVAAKAMASAEASRSQPEPRLTGRKPTISGFRPSAPKLGSCTA